MLRLRTALAAAFSVVLALSTLPLFAQQSPGVINSFSGTLSSPKQEDRIAFEVGDQFVLTPAGSVDVVFFLSNVSSATNTLDPGHISIAVNGSGSVSQDMRRPDSANSTASIALATLTEGMYEVTVRSEHKTTGEYRLDVLLAGDANGDLKVDSEDLAIIRQLNATKRDDPNYSAAADVDRNGVINGGDRQRAEKNAGAGAVAPEESNPLDQGLPASALALVGKSPELFNSRSGGLQFSLTGAEFDTTVADVTLKVNGNAVPASRLVIAPHLLTADVMLADGRNDIDLKVYDTIGRPLYRKVTLWAGSGSLRVNLIHQNGTPFLSQTNVVAALSDDASVTAQGLTSTGTITFTNVPFRTVLIKAKGAGNEIGTAGVLIGSAGTATIKMTAFNAPSSVDNNDISLGTAGWVIGPGSPVSVVPHKEDIPGFFKSGPAVQSLGVTSAALVDQDLMLGTSGTSEQTLSRAFTTTAGTTAVRIRYRFITSEVPGGYYGTQYNDYFRVSLRTQNGGGVTSETNSMNGLGLGAFHYPTGETDWREATLEVDTAGDTIQADLAVSNVGDGALQSQVVVDFVEEIKDQVRPALAWNNTAGGLRLTWEVLDRALENPVTIRVYFASGTGYADRLGVAVFEHVLPAGTAVGTGGPVHVSGTLLEGDPAGTTHLVATSSETMVGALADVVINYAATADAGAVSAGMTDIVKDGFRASGSSSGTITSTLRSPADQARAMFNNAVNTGAASQLALYGPAGDAVIRVYIAETAGMTTAQIRANAGTIRAAMEAEINAQGPENVSRHCGDPAVRTVVDVAYSSFTSAGRGLFRTSVTPRVSRILDEPNNNCIHLELVN